MRKVVEQALMGAVTSEAVNFSPALEMKAFELFR
jgi:hypothetical protein